MIVISRKDIIWGYFSQFFSVASGIVTLPLILKMLSAEEVGMNYLMLTLGSLVALLDFGFTPQFSRNITYIFSGAQQLKKEGVTVVNTDTINYRLLATMVFTAKLVYKRLAIIVLIIMLTLGTLYIYYVTKKFTTIENSLFIWILYSISIFFNIYYSYYNSLLLGKGLIMESKKALVYSKLTYVFLTFLFLFLDFGLLSIVIANLLSPFVSRYLSYKFFFTDGLREKMKGFTISKDEKLKLFEIIWFNAKKIGLVFVGAYAINKLSIFLAGIYLSLPEIASYGLMIQLFALLSSVAGMFFNVIQPRFSNLRTKGEKKLLIKEFAYSMNIFYLLFISGTFLILFVAPFLISLISSNTQLPSFEIMVLFSIVLLLEGNHSSFATFIVTDNKVPFVVPTLIAGFFIGIGDFIFLKYTGYGVLGLVLIQGLVQLLYANWKWPSFVCNEFRISFSAFVILGFNESYIRLKSIINQ